MAMRWLLSMATVLVILGTASGIRMAAAGEPGHLAALAARQNLCDEVCIAIAMGDGRLTPGRRYEILSDAKRILKPEEYAGFRQNLDRVSPPPPPAQHVASIKRLPMVAKKKVSTGRAKATSLAKALPEPSIPRDAILPDRVVLTGWIQ